MSVPSEAPLIEDFSQTLVDCRQLYLNAAREWAREGGRSTRHKTPGELIRWMDDLHRGLLIKIYLDVALADERWHAAEQALATALFEHLWNRKLTGAALREAARGLRDRAQHLSLRSVIAPFAEIDLFRERVAELETIVMRLGNLIAKADGELKSCESLKLKQLQSTIQQLLPAGVTRETGGHRPEAAWGPAAYQQLAERAEGVRRECQLAREIPDEIEPSPERNLAEAMARLDRLIGLDPVKQEIRTLANFLKLQQQRREAGLPETRLSLHLVFTGNPGTGKTTVARIVGQLYGAMGILAQGHLVETDRSGLVAEYAGQTATKTNALVDRAP